MMALSSSSTEAVGGAAVGAAGGAQGWPDATGLLEGLGAVLAGQIVVFLYYLVLRASGREPLRIRPPPASTLLDDLWEHVSRPESFMMVYGYLAAVWMFRLMPASYYDRAAPLELWHVAAQFLCVDFFIYCSHRVEHRWRWFYTKSHKQHHRWHNPRLYNAFNGSILDTLSLIVIPLFLTHQVCFFVSHASFVCFGVLYSAQFVLIHCEIPHPWDGLLRMCYIGTAADHNVHHLLRRYNFGHFFMIYDALFGTYCDSRTIAHYRDYTEAAKDLNLDKIMKEEDELDTKDN